MLQTRAGRSFTCKGRRVFWREKRRGPDEPGDPLLRHVERDHPVFSVHPGAARAEFGDRPKTPGEAAFLSFAEAAEIRLEEQPQRLRSGVAKVVGARLADPVSGVCHSVSWTIRPLRLRPARSQRPG